MQIRRLEQLDQRLDIDTTAIDMECDIYLLDGARSAARSIKLYIDNLYRLLISFGRGKGATKIY